MVRRKVKNAFAVPSHHGLTDQNSPNPRISKTLRSRLVVLMTLMSETSQNLTDKVNKPHLKSRLQK